jgi:hypothetical protein
MAIIRIIREKIFDLNEENMTPPVKGNRDRFTSKWNPLTKGLFEAEHSQFCEYILSFQPVKNIVLNKK